MQRNPENRLTRRSAFAPTVTGRPFDITPQQAAQIALEGPVSPVVEPSSVKVPRNSNFTPNRNGYEMNEQDPTALAKTSGEVTILRPHIRAVIILDVNGELDHGVRQRIVKETYSSPNNGKDVTLAQSSK